MNTAIGQPEVAAEPDVKTEQIGRSVATGGLFMLFGRVAVLPTGLIVAAFLARMLGPAEFGLYSVAISIILWVRMTISMLFQVTSSDRGLVKSA